MFAHSPPFHFDSGILLPEWVSRRWWPRIQRRGCFACRITRRLFL